MIPASLSHRTTVPANAADEGSEDPDDVRHRPGPHPQLPATVRELIDDPQTPDELCEVLRRWTPAQQAAADRMGAPLQEVFRGVATREGLDHADYDQEVVPCVNRAVVLMVAAGLEDSDLAVQVLLRSLHRDEMVLGAQARYARAMVGSLLPLLGFAALQIGMAMSRRPLHVGGQVTPAAPMAVNYARLAPMRAAASAVGESVAERVQRGRLCSAHGPLTNPLAQQVARRLALDPVGDRNLRSGIQCALHTLLRGVAVPTMAAVLGMGADPPFGSLSNVWRWSLDFLAQTQIDTIVSGTVEHEIRLLRLTPNDYALLLLSQPDFARRVGALADLANRPPPPEPEPSWTQATMQMLRQTLQDLPRASTLAHALVLLACHYTESMVLADQPWPVGAANATHSDHSPRDQLTDDTMTGMDCFRMGMYGAAMATVTTYAALTVRAHAPAIDAQVAGAMQRLRRWVTGSPSPNGAEIGRTSSTGRGAARRDTGTSGTPDAEADAPQSPLEQSEPRRHGGRGGRR
ncbi:hypothetical protein [Roseateles amylovorans]|uniref:HDOD domain-containing protein n=1 Tax=Roseateles amylovorans TaxID=2978473 RepID=A0ABY6AVS1_9BURK|nr:hypothetical protein [Roseateles amylovorans]UXH76695.1 hypothetical protein N4261_16825 [Roseateles amylovorans]